MRVPFTLLFVLSIFNASFAQGVVSWINLENQFVLEPLAGRAVDLVGLGLRSEAGLLTAGTSADPFLFRLPTPTPQYVAYGTLGAGPRIKQSTTLDVRYDLQAALEMGLSPCEEIEMGFGGGGTLHCPIPGDANFSGTVDFYDFLILSDNFGQTGTDWPSGDFDWDRRTGFSDFLRLSNNFGKNFYDFTGQPGEPLAVRKSTSEETNYLNGDFSPPPLSPITPHGDYFIDEGRLWSHLADANPGPEPLGDQDSITIVAPGVDFGRATHFGVALTRDGQDFEIASVRLMSSSQTLEFNIPDDLTKSLVLPIGMLETGQYDIGITRYEFTVDGALSEFDVSGFLADPTNFELPGGPALASVTTSSLSFQVEASEAVSVPEPRFSLFSTVLFVGLAIRRYPKRRLRSHR